MATAPPAEGSLPAPLSAPAALGWALVYLLVTLVPLFVVSVGRVPPDRGFWLEFGVALGFVGLAMLALQSILTARFARVSATFGQDTLLQFHRQAGIVAFGLVLAHPVVLIAAESNYWDFLDPRVNIERAVALWFVVFALPLLIITALWREKLRIPYDWWRLGHGVLAGLIVVVGIVHIFRVQHYLDQPAKQILWIAIVAISLGCIAYVRVLTPLRMRSRPHSVQRVTPEADRTWTLSVAPDSSAEGEAGEVLDFQPGQFVFLTLAASPFAIEQHPFSVASGSGQRDRLELTIKELGDFTNRIGEVQPGQRAFVDGPYGGMALRRNKGLLAVAGGIGVTPIMSMIRTIAETPESQPIVLIYANNRLEDVAYAEELRELAGRPDMDLEVVIVLSRPPENWSGPTGFVTEDLLDQHLPEPSQRADWQYVLCGPPPMMEVTEQALLRAGVPLRQIDAERFDIGASTATGRRGTTVRRLVVTLGATMVAGCAVFAGLA